MLVAKKLKAEGVKAGVPDLCLPIANDDYNGLFIEMKAAKGRVQPTQKQWLEDLNENGYLAVVCYGFEDAKKVISNYMGM